MKNPFPEPSNNEDEHETAELDIGFPHLSLWLFLYFSFFVFRSTTVCCLTSAWLCFSVYAMWLKLTVYLCR